MCELCASVQKSKSIGSEVEKWSKDGLVSVLVEPKAATQGQFYPNKLDQWHWAKVVGP